MQIIRASLAHAPHNPFLGGELVAYSDGAIAVQAGRIVAVGSYPEVQAQYPQAQVDQLRGGLLIPGMVDLHVHYPQARIIGALGYRLLDWLAHNTLPEEARLANPEYARSLARDFLGGLLRNGTTTALVFGSHFAQAMDIFFEEASQSQLRIIAGLVISDRLLRPGGRAALLLGSQADVELPLGWVERACDRYVVGDGARLRLILAREAGGAPVSG